MIFDLQQQDEVVKYVEVLRQLDEPQDEVGFIVRVGFAKQIAAALMKKIHHVPVEIPGRFAALEASSGAELLRLAKTTRIKEQFAHDWESFVQARLPAECGLRFYLDRRLVAGTIAFGFRFGPWDTATI